MNTVDFLPFLPIVAFVGILLNTWAFGQAVHKVWPFDDKPWKRLIILAFLAAPYAYFVVGLTLTLSLFIGVALKAAVDWVRTGDT